MKIYTNIVYHNNLLKTKALTKVMSTTINIWQDICMIVLFPNFIQTLTIIYTHITDIQKWKKVQLFIWFLISCNDIKAFYLKTCNLYLLDYYSKRKSSNIILKTYFSEHFSKINFYIRKYFKKSNFTIIVFLHTMKMIHFKIIFSIILWNL